MNLARPSMHVLVAAFLVACATAEPRPQLTPASGPAPAGTSRSVSGSGCPLGVSGAKVSIENVSRGVILTFTVQPTDELEDLRVRVRNVAVQHGPGAHMGPGHDGEHGTGEGHGIHFADMPPVETSFQSVDGGARLHVLANDPADVRAVQDRMWSRMPHIAAGECR